MKHSQHLWRGLFFILLITALCGGLALPIVSVPARAAPQMQVTSPAIDVVISEFRTRGPKGGNDEFIELYNPTSNPVDISGWKINGSGNTGSTGTRAAIPSLTTRYSGQYYLVANTNTNGYSGSVSPNLTYSSGISDNGGIALVRSDSSVADQVGMSSGSAYKEGTFLTPLAGTSDQSYQRKLGGASDSCEDTDDNSADFQLIAPSDPKNTSSPLSLCGTILPTFTPTETPTNTSTATNTATATSTGTTTNTPLPPTPGVVISEFRTTGPNGANDEFVELYNPTSNWIDISGWKINSWSPSSGSVSTRVTIPVSTILRSGQYYLIANNNSSGGYSGSVPTNLNYGTGISDDGGIALLKADNSVVDQIGMSATSTYKEGTVLPPLSGTSNQSYERKQGGASDSCQDTNNNANDFTNISPSNPHNYSSPLSLCGTSLSSPVTTTTTITADTPDPSQVYGYVSVSVRVTGGSTPTGRVDISGANTNCSITLNSSGTGSCTAYFTTSGTKTLTAIYLGDNTHLSSSDTEFHQVSSTIIRTPTKYRTATPKPLPPPPLVGINEFVPRPGHDWNGDGVVNQGDEYIELLNFGVIDVNLSGYSLDDEVNIGSTPYRLPSITLKPGERHVFYGSETGLLLSDGGDAVRLLKPNGQLADAYNYTIARYPDESFCRLPDNGGLDDWNQYCFPTPGLQNSLSGNFPNPPKAEQEQSLCPIADTLPEDFVLAECPPFGNNIWNPAYWDKFGWFDEKYLPESPGKWPLFAE